MTVPLQTLAEEIMVLDESVPNNDQHMYILMNKYIAHPQLP